MSCPSKRIVPPVGSSSFRTRRAVVDFPQPDSPTSPSVSPRSDREATRPRRRGRGRPCAGEAPRGSETASSGSRPRRAGSPSRARRRGRRSPVQRSLPRSHRHLSRALASRSAQRRRLSVDREMAGLRVATATVPELGPLLVAGREAVRAPRMERATRRNEDQRRRRALDRHEVASTFSSACGIDSRRPHVYGCSGWREDLVRLAALHRSAPRT